MENQTNQNQTNTNHTKNYHHNDRAPHTSSQNITSKLKIIPLGGQSEVGKNMVVYEYGNDIIVVDMGIMFPEEQMLGIDLVIPDFKYLEDNKSRIRGIFFTHGHEDHIGGVPYIWPRLGAPMYGTRLTAGLIEVKLQEFEINTKVNVVDPGQKIKLGNLEVEFIRSTHSIPDSVFFAITTPQGIVLHATDWKIDHNPVGGKRMDFARLAKLSQEGVLAMLSDSTNAERPGYTISEQAVAETLDNIFKNAHGRIVVASFASLINRIQQVIDAAHKYHRKVAISGRSMINNVDRAMKLGYLSVPQGTLVDIRRTGNIPDEQLVIMCTGSQGEEYSALVRMASGDHKQIKIKFGDTIIISASPIPGNERSIHSTVDSLFREGANVIYGKEMDIHVSGHANQEELKLLLALIRPKFVLPIHGEYRFLIMHAKLAQQVGVDVKNIVIADNGDIVEFTGDTEAKISSHKIQSGYLLVDGLGVGDVGNIVLRDRQAMAQDGIFVIILTVDKATKKIITSPDIISRGFVYMRAREDLIQKSRLEIRRMFSYHNEQNPGNWESIKKAIRDEMGDFLYNETQRRPMVIPVIIEI